MPFQHLSPHNAFAIKSRPGESNSLTVIQSQEKISCKWLFNGFNNYKFSELSIHPTYQKKQICSINYVDNIAGWESMRGVTHEHCYMCIQFYQYIKWKIIGFVSIIYSSEQIRLIPILKLSTAIKGIKIQDLEYASLLPPIDLEQEHHNISATLRTAGTRINNALLGYRVISNSNADTRISNLLSRLIGPAHAPAPAPAPAHAHVPANRQKHVYPIPKNIAETLIRELIKNQQICPISHEPLQIETTVLTSCFHVFNGDALTTWLTSHNSCPICKQSTEII